MMPKVQRYATRLMTCDDAAAVTRITRKAGGMLRTAQDVGEAIGNADTIALVATLDDVPIAYALAVYDDDGIEFLQATTIERRPTDHARFALLQHLIDLVPAGQSLTVILDTEDAYGNDFLRSVGLKAVAWLRDVDAVEMAWRRR